MNTSTIILTIAVGIFIVLVTPSLNAQRERIWGPGQKARIQKAKDIADQPSRFVAWAIREAFIILWFSIVGVLLVAYGVSAMLIDHIRGISTEHYAYTVFMLMFLAGMFLSYVGVRGTSQVVRVLDEIMADDPPSDSDSDDK